MEGLEAEGGLPKQGVILADAGRSVKLTLWEKSAEKDKTYRVSDVVVGTHLQNKQLPIPKVGASVRRSTTRPKLSRKRKVGNWEREEEEQQWKEKRARMQRQRKDEIEREVRESLKIEKKV